MSNTFYSSLWPFIVDQKLDQLRRTLELLEEKFKVESEDLKKWHEENVKGVIDPQEFGENVADEAWELDHMSHISRSALFTVCFAFVENELNNFCSIVKSNRKLTLDVQEIHGKGIQRAKIYLEKLAGINLPDMDEWSEIVTYNIIRNCVLHNGGVIRKDDYEKIKNYQKKHKNIEVDMHLRVTLSVNFCYDSIKVSKSFLLSLQIHLDKQFKLSI